MLTLVLIVAFTAPTPAQADELVPGSPKAIEAAMKLIVKADDAAKAGRLAKAIELAEQVVALAPAAPGPARMIGEMYFGLGDCAQALKHDRRFERVGRDKGELKRAKRRIEECAFDKGRKGKLEVTVLPKEAAVRILAPWQEGPVEAAAGSLKAKLPSGEYRLQASLPGYAELDVKVRIKPGTTVTVAESLSLRPASLQVNTVPPGAKIFVDGEPVGVAPVELSPLAAGDHEVSALLDGHAPVKTRTRVGAGQGVSLTLRPTPALAKLSVVVNVGEASVEVDGAVRCHAPCAVELPPLELSTLRVLAPGRTAETREVTPQPGQAGELRFDLPESPAAAQARSARRWALSFAAAGAILGGAGAIALSSALGTQGQADDAYQRYTAADTSAGARAAWKDTESLDAEANTQLILSMGLLGGAGAAALLAGWEWTAVPASAP